MNITLIGHSTLLIESGGSRILTDPWFGRWGNPVYRRLAPPILEGSALLDVNLVVVSHDHWDHQDPAYLRRLGPQTPVVVPSLLRPLFSVQRIATLVGLRPWETRAFGPVEVTAVPAIHSLGCAGYVIKDKSTAVYFSGDTYYGSFMEEIGRQYNLSAALIPVTTYRIPMTINMTGAVRATQVLHPKVVIPVHLGIIPRSPLLRTRDTVQGYCQKLAEAGVKTEVILLKEGESASIS